MQAKSTRSERPVQAPPASSKASHSALLASGLRDPPAELWIIMQLYEGIIFAPLPDGNYCITAGQWTYRIKYRPFTYISAFWAKVHGSELSPPGV